MKTEIVINGIVDGMNGKKGLIREHFHEAKKKKTYYRLLIRTQTMNKHKGAVRVSYVGHKAFFMDWDNFCASFKHLGDSLVKEGVIIDDGPNIIKEFNVNQIKSKIKDQKVIITIEDYE